ATVFTNRTCCQCGYSSRRETPGRLASSSLLGLWTADCGQKASASHKIRYRLGPQMQGTIRLFNFRGIQVYLHFTWFLYALFQLTQRTHSYFMPAFAAYEYLSLFGIVLLHEFGHALACRQTGGLADQIVLWPLGGIAFVQPPRRPGAVLWSIAAGPLVNVILV